LDELAADEFIFERDERHLAVELPVLLAKTPLDVL
jgi:hypothetical protein